MIFDTHCHLNDDALYKELDLNIKNAEKLDVKKFLVVGYDAKSSLRAVEIGNKYPNVYAAVGFHPTEIENLSEEDFNSTLNLCSNPKVVAIGEIGLDYHWVKDPVLREIQQEYFKRQIIFANEHHLPISIHSRDANEDTLNILKEVIPQYGGIMHCYSGSVEMMDEFIKFGLYIALGGPVTFTNAKMPKLVAEQVPLDKLLLETDSPYLAPHPLRGMTNKPEYIRYVLDAIADIRGLSKKHIADITYKNSCELLKIKDE